MRDAGKIASLLSGTLFSSLNKGFVPSVKTKCSTVGIKAQTVLFKENALGVPEGENMLEKPVSG